jgi:hypothetical protein
MAETSRTSTCREVGVEVARLKSMVMICYWHFARDDRFNLRQWSGASSDRNGKFIAMLGAVFAPVVNTMIGISGVFGIHSSRLNVRRIFLLWFQVWCYNRIWQMAGRISQWPMQLSPTEMLFPVGTHNNWFVHSYFRVSFILPMLNVWLRSLTKLRYALLVLILCIFQVCDNYFIEKKRWLVYFPGDKTGRSPEFMVVMYVISGYFGLYGFPLPNFVAVVWLVIWGILTYKFYHNDIVVKGRWAIPWVWHSINLAEYEPRQVGLIIYGILELHSYRLLRIGRTLGNVICFFSMKSFVILLVMKIRC